MKFVLDCSVSMAWCFEDETNTYTESILDSLESGDHVARVPPIWKLEVINVLLITERKKRISKHIANNFKNALTILPISIDTFSIDRTFDTVYELARELHITAYDAAYLELAVRENIPLATQDNALIQAAQKIQIQLFNF
jgi:predicted nucleic acid-binding protein